MRGTRFILCSVLSLFELTKCPRGNVRSTIARISYRAVNSRYRSCKTNFSLFRAPNKRERLQQWARNIKRGEKTQDDACVVCERHFELSFIERTFKISIQAKVEEISRDLPLLAKEAVPTVFPDPPKYFSKPLSQKRKRDAPPLWSSGQAARLLTCMSRVRIPAAATAFLMETEML
ncbi:hypothetical protein HPB51_016854 [Rhipicephalus microplus]|uniref:THAP-type domain-containing protein n=1 Tax=Rhipicephalus microplus TaxID=6941 RepID=A0A9J6DI88_RHIMP|nr:hypothetical protein HPB51_016854 [Rhipicephalus microplus]